MDWIFWLGVLGAVVLVVSSALPDPKMKKAVQSLKNRVFALGSFLMLIYAWANWFFGVGEVFFIFLQLFVNVGSVLMMLDTDDWKVDIPLLSLAGALFVGWSLYIFVDVKIVLFVVGLVLIGVGYALNSGTVRRNVALFVGSGLIAVFSYWVGDAIFMWLNVFFAGFSGYYALSGWLKGR